jgi:hypothetical protein
MSTLILPSVNSIVMDDHRPIEFTALSFGALGSYVRTSIRTVSDLLERRFADFAGVPYQNPHSQREWEELWETEAKP